MSDFIVNTIGSGKLGPVEPGWTVQEFATPVNPNERSGGTGSASYSGADYGEGLLLINDDVTVTAANLGSLSGVIRTVSKSGQRIDCTQDTLLARYDAIRNMPPMIACSVPNALDLAEQMLGFNLCSKTTGAFWSLNGHGVGFDANGNQVSPSFGQSSTIFSSGSSQLTANYTNIWYSVEPSDPVFIAGTNKTWVRSVTGSTLSPNPNGILGLARLACKVRISSGNNWSMYFSGGPFSANEGLGFYVTVTIDWSAQTLSYAGEATVGGMPGTPISGTASIASLNRDAELAVFMDYGKSDGRAQLNVQVCNTSNYSTVVSFLVDTQTFTPNAGLWQITGNTRALWMDYDNNFTNQTPAEYEIASPVNATTESLGVPISGWSGNVWEWLQMATSAHDGSGSNWEIALVNGVVTARRSGQNVFDFNNYEASPTVTPSSTQAGRQINVEYSNSVVTTSNIQLDTTGNGLPFTYDTVSRTEVYNARSDNNRILSVNVAETTTTTIQTKTYLTSIQQPTRVFTPTPQLGTYHVIDSTGLPIVARQWEDNGGSLVVEINLDNPGAIDVTLFGPSVEIPSTSAPYSLAISDGVNQYASLSIFGSGVISNPKVLKLLTGVDPSKITQEIAFTITNPFINTLEQAFDSGAWASLDGSGPRIDLSLTVPTSDISGLGLVAGSIINFQNCNYRIMSASIGRTSTTLECVRHVTVGSFDAVWAGDNVGDHDLTWLGYQCVDQDILPYKK